MSVEHERELGVNYAYELAQRLGKDYGVSTSEGEIRNALAKLGLELRAICETCGGTRRVSAESALQPSWTNPCPDCRGAIARRLAE